MAFAEVAKGLLKCVASILHFGEHIILFGQVSDSAHQDFDTVVLLYSLGDGFVVHYLVHLLSIICSHGCPRMSHLGRLAFEHASC